MSRNGYLVTREQAMKKTLVIFRRFKDNGDIIALFPEEPHDLLGRYCVSYMRVGQHAGADYPGVIRASTPAKRSEYASLARELRRIGYKLRIGNRASPVSHKARQLEASANNG